MGERSGRGRQSQSQELCPRGFPVAELWASLRRGLALWCCAQGPVPAEAALGEGLKPDNVQRVGLLSGSPRSLVLVLGQAPSCVAPRGCWWCGGAAGSGTAPMGALLRHQPGTCVGVPGADTSCSQKSPVPRPGCAGDA